MRKLAALLAGHPGRLDGRSGDEAGSGGVGLGVDPKFALSAIKPKGAVRHVQLAGGGGELPGSAVSARTGSVGPRAPTDSGHLVPPMAGCCSRVRCSRQRGGRPRGSAHRGSRPRRAAPAGRPGGRDAPRCLTEARRRTRVQAGGRRWAGCRRPPNAWPVVTSDVELGDVTLAWTRAPAIVTVPDRRIVDQGGHEQQRTSRQCLVAPV
jgi:hypothetical protein